MEREALDSSDIRSVGYDQENQILEVEFHNGDTYHYFDVAKSIHKALMGSPSASRFLQYCVKGIYPDKKL